MGFVSCFSINNGKYIFSDFNVSSVLFYLGIYLFTNLGAFGMLIWMCQEGKRGDQLEDWRGLGQSHPWFGMCFVIFLLSLAGIPPTAGFVGKLYLFAAAIQNEFYWLLVMSLGQGFPRDHRGETRSVGRGAMPWDDPRCKY